jgi:hypothetical protein
MIKLTGWIVPVIMGKSPVITADAYSITPNPPVIIANSYSITASIYSKLSISAVILPNIPVITAGVPVITAKSGGITTGVFQ